MFISVYSQESYYVTLNTKGVTVFQVIGLLLQHLTLLQV